MRHWLLLLWIFSFSSEAQTLEEIWQKTLSFDRDLKTMNGNREIQLERKSQADISLAPELRTMIGESRGSNEGNFILSRSVQQNYARLRLNQKVFDHEVMTLRRQAKMRIEKAEHELASTTDWIRFNVTADYFELIQSQRKFGYWKRVLSNSNRIQENLEALERVGLINRESYNFLLSRLSRLRSQGQAISNALLDIHGRLQERTGLSEIRICTESLERFPLIALKPQYRESPEVQARAVERRIAEEQLQLEKSRYFPKVELFAEKAWQRSLDLRTSNPASESSNWAVGIELNWSLTDSFRQRSRVREYETISSVAALGMEKAASSHRQRLSILEQQNAILADRIAEIHKLQSSATRMLDSLQEQDQVGTEMRSSVISNSLSALEILLNTIDDETSAYLTHINYRLETGSFNDEELIQLSNTICSTK